MNRPAFFRKPLSVCVATLLFATSATILPAAQPVIEDPLKVSDELPKVAPRVPVGKTLMIPIAASDSDGHALTYKVTSSNPNIMVRVRTGRPHMKIAVDYAGDPASETPDPGFTGELEFQLFRDWTPETANYIAGFAQSLFFSPKTLPDDAGEQHTIFHRVIKDFMCQTGDPNSQIPDPEDDDEDPIQRGPGFTFDDELGVPMIFTGRGQLAMANRGFASDFKGTNGSQFFITTGSPRHLDFKHTILGQMVRGWEILEKMQNVPVKEQDGDDEVSRPKTDIKITDTWVEPNSTDALLVLSAKTKGTATIRVTATDSEGVEAVREFEVQAVVDDRNSGPFFSKNIEDRSVPKNKSTNFAFRAQDLEHDFITYQAGVVEGGSNGSALLSGTQIKLVPRAGFSGPLKMAYAMTQYDMGSLFSRGFDGARSVQLGVGEKDLRTKVLPVFGAPNVALNTVPLATFVDSDARGSAGSATVSINWGDGTPSSSAVLSFDRSRPTVTGYQINGSHVYARAGHYPIVITMTSGLGLSEVIRTVAVISSQPLKLFPLDTTVPSRLISGKRLAKIIDEDSTGRPRDYEATIDWGDGSSSAGVIKRSGAGELYVTGSHRYSDPDTYSVAIRVRKTVGENPASAFGWTNLTTRFAQKESYLPPFPMAHIVAGLSNIPIGPNNDKDFVDTTGSGANERTVLTFSLGILNSGNKTSNPSKIRFYLSTDRVLNLEPETYTDESADPPVERTRPKDIPLLIGDTQKEVSLIALKPGMGGGIPFDLTASGDSRIYLPKGETGKGYNLLAALVYDDPLAKLSPIAREEIREVLPPFSPNPTAIEITETPGPKHTQSFEVVIDRKPNAPVTIPLTAINSSQAADATEFYFNAALPVPPEETPELPPDQNLESSPDQTITYTPEMWEAGTKKITVQVTGKQDEVRDTNQTAAVRIGPSTSDDPRFHGKFARLMIVNVVDRDSLITVSPSSLVTTEATGSSHSKTFVVRMLKKPAADVIVPVVNGDETEGVVTAAPLANGQPALTVIDGKPSLTFSTSETYPVNRTFTVTAVDDQTTDGTAVYTITVGPSTSTDVEFNGIKPANVTVSNLDNPVTPPPTEEGEE